VTIFHAEEIQIPGSTPGMIVRRLDGKGKGKKKKPGRIFVLKEHIFDANNEWHHGNGHVHIERTATYFHKKYFNCTQRLVRIYCSTCFACMRKNPVTKPARESKKPILTQSFHDRFLIDLIDFCKLRKHDPFGVLMRWVMTIQDHCTGLVYLFTIPRKCPKLVAYKLQEIFGAIGYPKIFHTGNGKEFTGKIILELICELNPNIFTVTSQPQRPCDQGFVENMNQVVKRVLRSILTECRLIGQNPNCTEVLGTVAATINSQHGRGKMILLVLKRCMAKSIITQCCAQKRRLVSARIYLIGCVLPTIKCLHFMLHSTSMWVMTTTQAPSMLKTTMRLSTSLRMNCPRMMNRK
jgi:hypothetical protein